VAAWFSADGKRHRRAFSEPEEASGRAEATVSSLGRGDAAVLGFTGTNATLFHPAYERFSEWGVSPTEFVADRVPKRGQFSLLTLEGNKRPGDK
jgi:hypothetical protein